MENESRLESINWYPPFAGGRRRMRRRGERRRKSGNEPAVSVEVTRPWIPQSYSRDVE